MQQPLSVSFLSESPSQPDISRTLAEGQPWFVIGRGSGVDLSLDHPTVGQRHCQLAITGGAVRLQNLDFARGTWRNGLPIDDVDEIREGDRIEIGDLAYTVQIRPAPAPATAEPQAATVVTSPIAEPQPPAEAPIGQPSAAAAPSMPLRAESAVAPLPPPPVSSPPPPAPVPPVASVSVSPGATEARSYAPLRPTRAGSYAGASGPASTSATPPPERAAAASVSTAGFASATSPPQLDRPAAPISAPAPAAPPPTSSDPAIQSTLDRLEQLCPAQLSGHRPAQLLSLVERGRQQATKLGFREEDEIAQFIQCVLLLDDELTAPNTRNADVWYTLTSVSRPPAMRLRRALTVAQRQAAAGQTQAAAEPAPPPLAASVPSAVAPPLPPPTPVAPIVTAPVPPPAPVAASPTAAEPAHQTEVSAQAMDGEQLVRIFREQAAQLKSAPEIFRVAGVDPATISPELRSATQAERPYYQLLACWFAAVADALDQAHAMGVIHRDIKPGNLLLSQDGRLTLHGLDHASGGNSIGGKVGTPPYLSPEMLAAWAANESVDETDQRVDLWGMGVTLYEFLAFRPAYDGPLGAVLRDIATRDPLPLRRCVEQVPEQLELICLKAMHRNPDARYRRAADLAIELRAFAAVASSPQENPDRNDAEPKPAKSGLGALGSWLKKSK